MFSNFTVPLLYIYPPWYLMQYDWLVPNMRLQVIQDSLFSRLGSGPFSGRGKRESRNRTISPFEVCDLKFDHFHPGGEPYMRKTCDHLIRNIIIYF